MLDKRVQPKSLAEWEIGARCTQQFDILLQYLLPQCACRECPVCKLKLLGETFVKCLFYTTTIWHPVVIGAIE